MRGKRLHEVYVGLSVKAGSLVERGWGFREAVRRLWGWVVGELEELGSPDPLGDAELVVGHRVRYGFAGLPVRGEVEVRSGLVRGRVDLVEGGVPVEVKTGRPWRGDVVQALAYGLAMDASRVALDYLGRGRVWLRVNDEGRRFVVGLVGDVLEAVADPWSVGGRARCESCPYRSACRLVFF